jgi:hypothetical protein
MDEDKDFLRQDNTLFQDVTVLRIVQKNRYATQKEIARNW